MNKRILSYLILVIFLFVFINGNFVGAESQAVNINYENSLGSIFSEEIFYSSFLLQVNTENDTICKYSTNKNFDFIIGNDFDTDFNGAHKKIFSDLSPGVYNYYVKCYGDVSQLNISILVNPCVTGKILLSESEPLKGGRVELTLVTSKPVSPVPKLEYSFDGVVYKPLTIVGSGTTWEGYFIIEENFGEGLVSFKLEAMDLEGRVGTEITSGAVYAIDTIKPKTVSAITAEGLEGEIKLKWRLDEDYEEFNIYRSDSKGVDYTDFYETSDEEDFRDVSVVDGKTYYYRISAVDDAGNEGDLSIEVYAAASSEDNDGDSSGLALNLRGSVDSFLNEIDFEIEEVEDINSALSSKTEKERELFSNLKLKDKITKTLTELNSLRRDVEKYKLQDLTKESLDQKLASSRLKLEVITRQVPEDLIILEEDNKKEIFDEEDIRKSILELETIIDEDILDKSVKKTLDLIEENNLEITSNFKIIEIIYSDGTKKKISVVERVISSILEKSDNGFFVENIPKEVVESASEIEVRNLNYDVVKEDPILSFGSDTKNIFYFFDGDAGLGLLKTIDVEFVSIFEEESSTPITGYFLFGLADNKKYIGIIIAVILMLSFAGYFFYKKRNNFSEQYFNLLKKINLVIESSDENAIVSIEKDYTDIRKEYASLPENEKRAIYPKIEKLQNKLLVLKLEKGVTELKKTGDKKLFANLEKIYNGLSDKYKKKLEVVFSQVKRDIEAKELESQGGKSEEVKEDLEKKENKKEEESGDGENSSGEKEGDNKEESGEDGGK
ncbi:hypothetical protein K9L16_01400 [Candidatus Pacearchaeota archaeon]|nr:hypothetical protein [Candidatus Pacearchaeota archaeon]